MTIRTAHSSLLHLHRSSVRRASSNSRSLKVAVVGCCHGRFNTIYETIQTIERVNSYKVDLVLLCGDIGAMRTPADLKCLAAPPQHRKMTDFHRYYTGERTAPIPTVVVGGNHEASNYLRQLYHGGFLAPNIYFIGAAGIVNFGGLRIGGISGIYNEKSFDLGLYESIPYDARSIRTVYHVKRFDVDRLAQISGPVDIMISHDWPQGITAHGPFADRVRAQGRGDLVKQAESFGSPPFMHLLLKLCPRWWISGHMHVHFSAQHEATGTQFLALDQPKEGRQWLEILDLDVRQPAPTATDELTFDPEWLGITRAMHQYMPLTQDDPRPPSQSRLSREIRESVDWIRAQAHRNISQVQKFSSSTSEERHPSKSYQSQNLQTRAGANPQTLAFLSMLGLQDRLKYQS